MFAIDRLSRSVQEGVLWSSNLSDGNEAGVVMISPIDLVGEAMGGLPAKRKGSKAAGSSSIRSVGWVA
jgi:hypothetical protein